MLETDYPDTGEKEVLSQHVQEGSLRFSYAYRDEKDPGGKIIWKDQWKETFNPAGVRVEIVFINPDNPSQPLTVQRDILIPTGSWGRQED